MDYKADRIMDYAVYSLKSGDDQFKKVMDVPLKTVSMNGTTCSSWVVRIYSTMSLNRAVRTCGEEIK